jgi:pimeloyl-ACP methyl ester carboxylesterase
MSRLLIATIVVLVWTLPARAASVDGIAAQVPAFSDDYRVITLDLPGHGQIEAPALAIVAGTAQVPSAEALEEIVPNFEGTRIEGTRHFLMREKPDEFNRLLEGFLDQIDF